jgi:hypothetical protein
MTALEVQRPAAAAEAQNAEVAMPDEVAGEKQQEAEGAGANQKNNGE